MSQFSAIDSRMMAALSKDARNAPKKRINHNLHSDEKSPCQRLLNAIEPQSYIRPHRHLDEEKAETLIVLAGRVGVLAFDDTGAVSMSRILAPNSGTVGVDMPAGVYHSVVALEPGSVIFESKAGPYVPLALGEKAPWAPADGSREAVDYLQFMIRQFLP